MITADLSGRAALVTGGASGIGLATVTLFARCGARVALNHLPADPAGPEAAARLVGEGLGVVAVGADVAEVGAAAGMVERALDAFGRLDILVNNAATPGPPEPIPPQRLDAMTEDFWQLILSTNLLGTFRCAHAAAEALRTARGAIVNLASIAGLQTVGSSIAYSASKAGVVSLTRNLARALAPEVRVNAVAPGAVDTPWTCQWPEQRQREAAEKALLKRRCQPEDIAEAILFLAAGGAMVTGQTLVVDGGLTLA
jgi:3-oxoacyl-[acyl-carrier protein] reductase